ncbi:glycosyltransferase family 4 protein [Salipiger sp. 1_MG-2023]|uniref:glycosyltransferase family 4 protein n=1 Tax=Salipiger sp. 1_MG-2023 TaxID=3062665 RepID=UPI0026E241BF|nr:glycosyltransferase family 4 protein [Salipiger sp. 1_MG-2023]MDO6587042.1 glycosyltransferase family 4 protein [Salipiger sp. 1_MG-2023]
MRILILAPQPFFVPRGTPIAVRALMQVLAGQGHEIDAICFAEGEDPGIPGVGLYRLPALPGLRSVPPGFSLKKAVCDVIMLPMAAWRLWRGRYDLVIAVEEAAFLALALKPVFGVPYIYDVDSSIPEQLNDKFALPSWLHRLLSRAEARAARGAVGAITCCRALEELVKGYVPGLPVQTLEDVTLIAEAGAPPEDCRFDEPVIMYIGNLESYQGVDLLIRGFARSEGPGRLVIIGGVQAHIDALRKLADEVGAGDRVSFLGPRPVERIGDYLSRADIVVSPRTQGRNTPMKVYSYLDSGRPLLATRLPTHTQVLDDEIALLVDPTPEDMARGIATLLGDADHRARLVEQARRRVASEFSPDAYASKLTSFLNETIAPRLAEERQ